jgi:hypothetical protein
MLRLVSGPVDGLAHQPRRHGVLLVRDMSLGRSGGPGGLRCVDQPSLCWRARLILPQATADLEYCGELHERSYVPCALAVGFEWRLSPIWLDTAVPA